MHSQKEKIKTIQRLYSDISKDITSRLSEFNRLFKEGTDEDIFAELVFCILTPQSKAQSCWECVEILKKDKLLLKGTPKEIAKKINKARFKNNKAKYIVEARRKFIKNGKLNIKSQISQFESTQEAREWLVNGTCPVRDRSPSGDRTEMSEAILISNGVKGIGYKEASHFLRNIGLGENIAILDRHILRNLKELGVIKEILSSISKKKYLEIEGKMKEFSVSANIPMDHLDLVFWYKETGEVFK
ncbi:MAG: N-glycosylase/DNA lyase [Candidatus Omnitrophica bacterium]|nr:N-glycosylase/DNA lyase [Candidatus Omnitrophota bacterium]MBU1047083.1 N-glycosylase/DNA lyase [Candidatus Omnitrophota bacterium]MBU1766827.1 N-glycosylase/DNA lyase [Candidatus Omnitrophota bacterium]MBU1888749.1 N-glycosylase/DNA lyase [Candidatus Omnitrophota bacterium]